MRVDECPSPHVSFTCNRRFPLIPCPFFPKAEAHKQNNTTSASRLTTLATLGSDQQVGLGDIISESYNKAGVSSRAQVLVESLFHTPVPLLWSLTSSPIEAHTIQHTTMPFNTALTRKLGIKGTVIPNLPQNALTNTPQSPSSRAA